MFCKLLKIRLFNSEIFLDTLLFRLIRFPQKVLMGFQPPLGLFSLERKGRPSCRVAFSFGEQLSVLSEIDMHAITVGEWEPFTPDERIV